MAFAGRLGQAGRAPICAAPGRGGFGAARRSCAPGRRTGATDRRCRRGLSAAPGRAGHGGAGHGPRGRLDRVGGGRVRGRSARRARGGRRGAAAAWGMLLPCGAGLAMALFGVALLEVRGAAGAPNLSALGFVLLLLGYGALAGLAPLHAWLPRAMAAAPPPVAAALAGLCCRPRCTPCCAPRRLPWTAAVRRAGAAALAAGGARRRHRAARRGRFVASVGRGGAGKGGLGRGRAGRIGRGRFRPRRRRRQPGGRAAAARAAVLRRRGGARRGRGRAGLRPGPRVPRGSAALRAVSGAGAVVLGRRGAARRGWRRRSAPRCWRPGRRSSARRRGRARGGGGALAARHAAGPTGWERLLGRRSALAPAGAWRCSSARRCPKRWPRCLPTRREVRGGERERRDRGREDGRRGGRGAPPVPSSAQARLPVAGPGRASCLARSLGGAGRCAGRRRGRRRAARPLGGAGQSSMRLSRTRRAASCSRRARRRRPGTPRSRPLGPRRPSNGRCATFGGFRRRAAPTRGRFPTTGAGRCRRPCRRNRLPRSGPPVQPEFLSPAGEGLHQIPLGPVRPLPLGAVHLRLHALGGTVAGMEAQGGYGHRGLVALMLGRSPRAAARVAARVAAPTVPSRTPWPSRARRRPPTGTAPPPRALALRAMMGELERIAGHLRWWGGVAAAAGLGWPEARCAALREARAPRRGLGVRPSVDAGPGGAGRRHGGSRARRTGGVARSLRGGRGGASGVGRRGGEPPAARPARGARADGADPGGPARGRWAGRARGRTVASDARRLPSTGGDGWAAALGLVVPVLAAGDAEARQRVLLAEIRASLGLAQALLDGMPPPGEVLAPWPQRGGEGVGVVEGPRGLCLHWLALDGDGQIRAAFALRSGLGALAAARRGDGGARRLRNCPWWSGACRAPRAGVDL